MTGQFNSGRFFGAKARVLAIQGDDGTFELLEPIYGLVAGTLIGASMQNFRPQAGGKLQIQTVSPAEAEALRQRRIMEDESVNPDGKACS